MIPVRMRQTFKKEVGSKSKPPTSNIYDLENHTLIFS